MRTKFLFVLLLLILVNSVLTAQQNTMSDSLFKQFQIEQDQMEQSFTNNFYSNYSQIYSLNEKEFVSKIDSLRKPFTEQIKLLEQKSSGFDKAKILLESKDIQFTFDKILLDYPYFHEKYTCKPFKSKLIAGLIKNNIHDFNNPKLLQLESFKSYLKAFLYYQSLIEQKKAFYAKLDSQQLNATLNIIPKFFSNNLIVEYLQYYHIYNHIDNLGIKNLTSIYQDFISTCKDTIYVNKVKALYVEDARGREGHLIKTYKTVDCFDLEIHLFLPENKNSKSKRPVIVYFSGGGWAEGKPDFNFPACQSYANKGWIGVAVEYRLAYRQNTLPFEAVMDAKSAIRWLRKHANEYDIDTNQVVVSGNSAGGHLALATALVSNWNEKTDDLQYSSVPNAIMVNSGVYDLTECDYWIRKGLIERNLSTDLVKEISPNYLVRKILPPILIIHGTNDHSVLFSTAEEFNKKMTQSGNNIEFHILEGAGHFIWYDELYYKKVGDYRKAFLKKLGY